jgi:Sulfotransferase family
MAAAPKCVIILSTKSAGSSALQELICRFAGGKHAEHTRHGEHETLYWTKAASALEMPQLKVPDSEVPIPRAKASKELREFLARNVPGFQPADTLDDLVFQGWHALALRYSPVFVEKSPHHLHQWSCLKLMMKAAALLPDLDFRFVGLVRNPMDVLYSAWTRWRTQPEDFQHHWRIAHENLERFRRVAGERLTIVRYEDLSAPSGLATDFLQQLGLTAARPGAEDFIHGGSRMRWKVDTKFGFQLDPTVTMVAKGFGYTDDQLHNDPRAGWRLYSVVARCGNRIYRRPVKHIRRLIGDRG